MLLRISILCSACIASVGVAHSASIRLRTEAQPKGTIVYLGDVADIHADDPRDVEELSSVELTFTPSGSASRYLRATQIQDLLNAKGFDLRTLRFGGAAQVKLSPAELVKKKPLAKASSYDQRRAERMAIDAIRRRLKDVAEDVDTWTIEIDLANADAARLMRTAGSLTASGGARPWTGGQHFQLRWTSAEGPEVLEVSAEIAQPESVVATIRAIPRGTLIRAEDVALRPAPNAGRVVQAAYLSIDDVVGKEAVRNIPAGQPVDRQIARPPVLVRQNDVVTVYSRAGGISVRTNARARQNGSEGEMITVETFDRKPFFARVSGHQEVEVLATPSTLTPPSLR